MLSHVLPQDIALSQNSERSHLEKSHIERSHLERSHLERFHLEIWKIIQNENRGTYCFVAFIVCFLSCFGGPKQSA